MGSNHARVLVGLPAVTLVGSDPLPSPSRGRARLHREPIAPTVQEGRDIVDAAHRAGVTLMVGHVERFNPAVGSIKRDSGSWFRSRTPMRDYWTSRTTRKPLAK
jgi:hypothetical protein